MYSLCTVGAYSFWFNFWKNCSPNLMQSTVYIHEFGTIQFDLVFHFNFWCMSIGYCCCSGDVRWCEWFLVVLFENRKKIKFAIAYREVDAHISDRCPLSILVVCFTYNIANAITSTYIQNPLQHTNLTNTKRRYKIKWENGIQNLIKKTGLCDCFFVVAFSLWLWKSDST